MESPPAPLGGNRAMNTAAAILVATEAIADAKLVEDLLAEEFENVVISSDPNRSVADFEQTKAPVLILAFNTLEKAEQYYLELYRRSAMVHALAHRTLILCNKGELLRAYDLCKREIFDDYILFWPMTHDAPRLRMAVHHALRQMAATEAGASRAGEFAARTRPLAALESVLEKYTASGEARIDVANRSLTQAKLDVGAALDSFSRRLAEGTRPDLVVVNDRAGFQREFDGLKAEEIENRFDAVAAAVKPVCEWLGGLEEHLAPQLESARSLKTMVARARPVALVVDDDEFQHQLLKRLLIEENLELVFTSSGTEAFASLRKRRPDLILMDVNLPDVGGVEAIRRLKSVDQFANIPVIMISGLSEKNVVVESLKSGALDFVVKPFDKDVLLAKVRRLLNGGSYESGAPAPAST
jgi:CheY-like chemotaxis protein